MPLASTPIHHQENISELNSTTKKKTTPAVTSEEEQILEILQRDETNSLYDDPKYNPECSSIKGSPDCDKCEILQLYITYCEKVMSSMQEELSTLKAKDIHQNAQTTEPSMNQSKECNAKNRPNRKKQTKTTKTKISIIGDSNTRRVNSQLNNKDRCADYTVWTNAGCRMQDLESRAHDMISGSDVGVIHLGTIDALSEDSDNDCLSGCSDAIDRIHDSTGNIPLVVCALPPTNNKRGQRRVNMINTLLDSTCRTNSKLQFLNSKLTLQDISGDGIHLNDSGNYKLAMTIQKAAQGFHPTHTCVHM